MNNLNFFWPACTLMLVACSPSSSPTELEVASDDRVFGVDELLAPGLEVTAGCSETELRTPIVTVAWRSDKQLDLTDRVDFAVGKQGFTKGFYDKVSFGPSPKIQKSFGLQKFEFDHEAGPALNLKIEKVQPLDERGRAGLRVQNLEPGLTYFVRVAHKSTSGWVASKTLRVEVPVCVADIVGEEP
jgi:hypothetical protein